jgi:predicted nucleic acid-binding protein
LIVVDVNSVSYLLIEGAFTDLAQQLYRRDNFWLLPAIWRHEFLNVLSNTIRFGGVAQEIGRETWIRSLALFGHLEAEVDMEEALHISIANGISAYDAQYNARAAAHRKQLITEDGKLLSKFPGLAQSLGGFLDATAPKGP